MYTRNFNKQPRAFPKETVLSKESEEVAELYEKETALLLPALEGNSTFCSEGILAEETESWRENVPTGILEESRKVTSDTAEKAPKEERISAAYDTYEAKEQREDQLLSATESKAAVENERRIEEAEAALPEIRELLSLLQEDIKDDDLFLLLLALLLKEELPPENELSFVLLLLLLTK